MFIKYQHYHVCGCQNLRVVLFNNITIQYNNHLRKKESIQIEVQVIKQ